MSERKNVVSTNRSTTIAVSTCQNPGKDIHVMHLSGQQSREVKQAAGLKGHTCGTTLVACWSFHPESSKQLCKSHATLC